MAGVILRRGHVLMLAAGDYKFGANTLRLKIRLIFHVQSEPDGDWVVISGWDDWTPPNLHLVRVRVTALRAALAPPS